MPPTPHPEAESSLRAAEGVVSLLAEQGVSAVVIGAVALPVAGLPIHLRKVPCHSGPTL